MGIKSGQSGHGELLRLVNMFMKFRSWLTTSTFKKYYKVKPVYKDHSREHENVVFMNSCPSYTG